MTLRQARQQFSRMVGKLLRWLDEDGQAYAIDMARRCQDCKVGHPQSLHKLGLAIDLLFYDDPDGDGDADNYRTDTAAYLRAGQFWESIGGTWGGRFRDGNHFSLSWRGMR